MVGRGPGGLPLPGQPLHRHGLRPAGRRQPAALADRDLPARARGADPEPSAPRAAGRRPRPAIAAARPVARGLPGRSRGSARVRRLPVPLSPACRGGVGGARRGCACRPGAPDRTRRAHRGDGGQSAALRPPPRPSAAGRPALEERGPGPEEREPGARPGAAAGAARDERRRRAALHRGARAAPGRFCRALRRARASGGRSPGGPASSWPGSARPWPAMSRPGCARRRDPAAGPGCCASSVAMRSTSRQPGSRGAA